MRSNKVGVKVDYGREGGGDVSRAKKKERSILDDDSDDDGMSGDLTDVGDRYMRDTTLHGLKYITEDRRHSAERIFWFVTCAIAWLFAAYFSYKVGHTVNHYCWTFSGQSNSITNSKFFWVTEFTCCYKW